MKGIFKVTQQLMSLFLVLVVSSMIFLLPPAIAATTSPFTTSPFVNITDENFEAELIEPSKSNPIILLLRQKNFSLRSLILLTPEIKRTLGSYKIVTGEFEGNKWYVNKIPRKFFPDSSAIATCVFLIFKDGRLVTYTDFYSTDLSSALLPTKIKLDNLDKFAEPY